MDINKFEDMAANTVFGIVFITFIGIIIACFVAAPCVAVFFLGIFILMAGGGFIIGQLFFKCLEEKQDGE